jgi:hypothetical protein
MKQMLQTKTILKESLCREEQEIDARIRESDSEIFLREQKIEEKKLHLTKLQQNLLQLE